MANGKRRKVVELVKARGGAFSELGRTGLKVWSGLLDEEFLTDLRGDKARRVYREMRENDPIIGAMLFAVEQLLRAVDINVEPASEGNADQDVAELVNSCLADMSLTWADTLSEILTMLPYGWSALEVVYKRRDGSMRDPSRNSRFADGRIGWRKLAIRAQDSLDRWVFDEEGGIQALQQRPAPRYELITIPVDRLLLFRTSTHKGSPEGRSILRNAYIPYYFAKKIRQIEGIGIERDLAGLPCLYAPQEVVDSGAVGDQATTRTELLKIIRNVRRDEQEGMLLPNTRDPNGNRLYEITLLSTGGRRQFDTDAIVQRYQREMAMVILADFILLGHEQVGSYALATDKSRLFVQALTGWLDGVLEVFNRHAIPRLLALNGISVVAPPRLTHGGIDVPNLPEIAAYLQALAGTGMPLYPDPDLENHLRRLAKLPELDAGEAPVGKRGGESTFVQAVEELRAAVEGLRTPAD